ncbi:MAG: hypothetical protein J6W64_06550 [Bacilli bacterium]|nr:hypothetical protein [Bacilli bacterium]
MNTPFKKRTDPFKNDAVVTQAEETVVKEPVREEKEVVAPKQKVKVVEVNDANREKYTATMDKNLRKRIKLAAIEAGVQVSTYIELACLEKLNREGR